MAKHDMGTPRKESLERHYQDEKKRLEAKIRELNAELKEAKLETEKLKARVEIKNAQIEVLLEKLVER